MKKLVSLLLMVVLFASCLSLSVAADDGEQIFMGHSKPALFGAGGNYSQILDDEIPSYVDLDNLKKTLLDAITKCQVTVSVAQFEIPYSIANVNAICDYLYYEVPEAFNVNSIAYSYTYSPSYLISFSFAYRDFADTASEYKACMSEIELAGDMLLKGIEGNDSLDDVEKALLIHDRLALWNEYEARSGNWPIVSHTAYGALVNRVSVCQGYTMAYMYLLNRVGIKNYYCDSRSLNHCWNVVYINNNPYHVDVTWDDIAWGLYEKGTVGVVSHKNFLRSSNGIYATEHTAFDYDTTPKDTTYDNYFWQNSETAFQLVNNELYYIDNNVAVLKRYSDNATLCSVNDIWWAGDNYMYWQGNFSCLASDGESLYYSMPKAIYKYNPTNNTTEKLYEPVFSGYNNFFGLMYECGYLIYDVNNVPPYSLGATSSLVRQKIAYNRENPAGHLYDYKCSETCDYCGFERTVKHTYSNACDKDCNVCKAVRTPSPHVYTSKKDASCNVCGKTRGIAKIVTQPKTVYAKKGAKASATVKATGDGLTYTWYVSDVGDTKYHKSSITSSTYTLKMTESNTNRKAYCVITDKYGNKVTTNTVRLRMKAAIATQPKTTYAKNGAKASVTVKATGEGLKYTWYVCDVGDTKYSKSSIKSSTYTLKMTGKNTNRKVYCVITDKYGKKVTSDTVRLRMRATIVTQPKTAYAKKGAKASVTVKAAGEGLKYTWYVKDVGDKKYKKSSLTSSTYSVKMTAANSNRKVYCVITDRYGKKVTTNIVPLRMRATIVTQPKSVTVAKNRIAKASVKAAGEKLTYSWYFKDAGKTKYTKSSIKSATYSCKMTSKTKGRRVFCIVKDRYGKTVQSKTIVLKMK